MKILILEDEELSARRASWLLKEFDQDIEVLDILESIEEAATWFQQNPEPDLTLLDIHLSDGLCFRLFEKVTITAPVIFTTAFDQYALQAFKINSIDYLLKPLDKTELGNALVKFRRLTQDRSKLSPLDIRGIRESMDNLSRKYKNRFLVKFGDTIQYKNADEIVYFYAEDKVVYLVTSEKRKFLIDYSLENLEELLDPDIFFRVNRKLIVRIGAIQKIKTLLNNRLQIFLDPPFDQDIYVSKEKSPGFKIWLDN